MKINKLFISILLFLIGNTYAKETKEEYVLLHWVCSYSADRSLNNLDLKGPCIDYVYNQQTEKREPKLYTKEECAEQIKKEVTKKSEFVGMNETYRDNYYVYIGGGLYTEGAGYYRYACTKYEDIKDYISRKNQYCFDYNITSKEFFEKCPSEVDENNLQIFNNIFPLDENEKESIEFTKRFDEEVRKAMKRKLKEVREEQRIKREKRNKEREKRKERNIK